MTGADPLVGHTVGNYTIVELLSSSDVGRIYLAKNPRIRSQVVVRVLPPALLGEFDLTARFIDAARAVNRIRHPGVVSVEDAGSEGEVGLYMVQERVKGQSLRSRLKAEQRLEPEPARRILRGVATVIAAAHAAGVLHRNLRPANIMLVPDREVSGGERVRVLGFSVAKLMDTGELGSNTATGVALGDYRYISPEQCLDSKSVSEASDVYALGVMGYRMLGGALPHDAPNMTKMVVAHHRGQVTPLSELSPGAPPRLVEAIHGALELDPRRRIPTAAALLERL